MAHRAGQGKFRHALIVRAAPESGHQPLQASIAPATRCPSSTAQPRDWPNLNRDISVPRHGKVRRRRVTASRWLRCTAKPLHLDHPPRRQPQSPSKAPTDNGLIRQLPAQLRPVSLGAYDPIAAKRRLAALSANAMPQIRSHQMDRHSALGRDLRRRDFRPTGVTAGRTATLTTRLLADMSSENAGEETWLEGARRPNANRGSNPPLLPCCTMPAVIPVQIRAPPGVRQCGPQIPDQFISDHLHLPNRSIGRKRRSPTSL